MTYLFLEGDSHHNSALSFIQGRQARWKFVNTYFLSKGGVPFFPKRKELDSWDFPSCGRGRVEKKRWARTCCSLLPCLSIFKGQTCLKVRTWDQTKGNYIIYLLLLESISCASSL